MKINLKTHRYATLLTYIYICFYTFSVTLRIIEKFIDGPLAILNSLIIQLTYILLFAYLGMFLASTDQPRPAIIAFALYVVSNILGIPTLFIQSFENLRIYSMVLGVLNLLVAIFFISQVLRLKHPVIGKYYKILAVIMGALAFLRIASLFLMASFVEYFGMGSYRISEYYTAIFSLFVPVVIILLLKRTVPLLPDYIEPDFPDEEYL